MIILSNSMNHFTTKRLAQEAGSLGIKSKTLNPYELNIPIDPQYSSGLAFHRSTGINYDDYDLEVALELEKLGTKIANPVNSLTSLRDKLKQHQFFKNLDLPHIPFASIRGRPEIEELFTEHTHFIIKSIRGNQGKGLMFINSRESLATVLEHLWVTGDQRYIVQPFIENIKEYRVFIIKDKFIGAIEKKIESGVKGNAKHCSELSYLPEQDLPQDIFTLAKESFDDSGADYAGIDIMLTPDGIKLLEINLVPGVESFEQVSGVNITRLIIESLIQ